MGRETNRLGRARDTGMAMTLLLLIAAYFFDTEVTLLPAILALVLTMVWPPAFNPLSPLWFGLAHVMGTLVSKVVLSLVFFLIATPVGLMRRLAGADPMRGKLWKKGRTSVLVRHNRLYTAQDLENPY